MKLSVKATQNLAVEFVLEERQGRIYLNANYKHEGQDETCRVLYFDEDGSMNRFYLDDDCPLPKDRNGKLKSDGND